ncbi:MAG: hypothetical protein GX974_05910 [Clostridiales bacterium]|nr:hypothetical protein [Clostridiales bacterium]
MYEYMHFYPEELQRQNWMMYPIMYPDIYYQIYPYASQICDRLDNPYAVYPSEALLDKMIDDCYDICIEEMPDIEEYAGLTVSKDKRVEIKRTGRSRLLRDIIAIILLSEFFRRRGRSPWIWGEDYGDRFIW